jgi:hypothetical protein
MVTKLYNILCLLEGFLRHTMLRLIFNKFLPKSVRDFIIQKTYLIHRRDLSCFVPTGAGSIRNITQLTTLAANQTFPFLKDLIDNVTKNKTNIYSIQEFSLLFDGINVEKYDELKIKLDKYGSDKAMAHNYHLIYACILNDTESITSLMEVGMGTNNTDLASNMGAKGKPGASLRVFRDFLPNAIIYGADIDKAILFEEERIKTFFIDQTRPETFEHLNSSISVQFDLIIDDGLHSPNANISTLNYALPNLKAGGWCVIEDIPKAALEIWHVVSKILPSDAYTSYIVKTSSESGYVFACQKK